MADELTIEGKQYISSKRAAVLSHYAQDYVGQLARAGLIDARRIGGLWYVYFDSLKYYKEKADTFVPKPPQSFEKVQGSDALVAFDGRDYISASKAAEITGYHQDYVGQLARAGKILSRQVGTRWYVDREALLAHKAEKDDLLGAVQAESVGIQEVKKSSPSYRSKFEPRELLSYKTDNRAPLIPSIGDSAADEIDDQDEVVTATNSVPIRVPENRQDSRSVLKFSGQNIQSKIGRTPRKTIFQAVLPMVILVVVLTVSLGSYYFLTMDHSNSTTSDSKGIRGIPTFIGDLLEPVLTKDLRYSRN